MNTPSSDLILAAHNVVMSFVIRKNHQGSGKTEKTLIEVLKGISFDVHKGEIIGIIGKNGSGKSTLLKIISNIIRPSSGSITIHGNYASILDIGNGFHPELTGRDNIKLYHSLLSPDTQPNFKKIIEFSELEEFMETPVKFYSNGMYLRLAFSIAIHCEANFIVLDEVISVGDISFMQKCYQEIIKRNQQGVSFLIVSHNHTDLLKLCTKCIWLDDGYIKASGLPTKVIAEYLGSTLFKAEKKNYYSADIETKQNADSFIWLQSAKVWNGNEDDSENVEISENIYFEICFKQKQDDVEIHPVIRIENVFGHVVTITTPLFQKENIHSKLSGLYKYTCVLQPNLLNIGRYKVSILFNQNGKNTYKEFIHLIEFSIYCKDEALNIQLTGNPYSVLGGQTSWERTFESLK